MPARIRKYLLETCSFEDWLSFTFDNTHDFYICVNTSAAATTVLRHCTRFFRDPVFILERYPKAALVKAFETIPSIDGDLCALCCEEIPWQLRSQCIQSLFELFARLFQLDQAEFLDGACFMWWEHLRGAQWNDGPHLFQIKPIVEEIFQLLERLLQINCRRIQKSALHGLNEFYDETRVMPIIDEYLAHQQNIDDDLRKYALICRDGDAQ